MGKIIKYIGLFLGSMLLISSCVYPFEPEDLDVEATAIVMEGDINIGDFSKFYSSTSVSISSDDMQVKNIPLDEIRVEGKNGAVCDAFTVEIEEDARYAKGEKRAYVLDTRTLPAEGDYRLVFRVGDKTYSSNWSQCLRTPEIDSITYSVKEDLSSLDILVHATGEVDSLKYYKWDFREDWEFHARWYASAYYDPVQKIVLKYPEDGSVIPNYYCWDTALSTDINIYSTEPLTENVVKNQKLVTIPNISLKISYLYSIEVYQKLLSEEGYKYWETLKKNSDGSSGIFAPQPNELKGNIICESDPKELVLGYISVSTVTRKRCYIKDTDVKIYKPSYYSGDELTTVDPEMWDSYYTFNWAPVIVDPMTGAVDWAPRRCVDCRVYGTKDKPSFWPNDHI